VNEQTIVVGVGGGDNGRQTLAWAVADAAAAGGRVRVCHVCAADSLLASYGGPIPLSVLELADPPLARAVAAARDRLGGQRVRLHVATGNVGEVLVREAGWGDLIVLGAPQHSGWASRASTTHHVIERAPCPTVVVRSVTDRVRGPFAGQVVVGVDGSAPARAALELGFRFATAHRRPLAGVHVSVAEREDIWFDETTLETHVVEVSEGLVLLADEVEPWQHKYPSVPVRRALYSGRTLPGLLRAAAGARLLVVGDRGRGPTARFVLGSVAHGAVDYAPCPVAVVRDDRAREDSVR
jgi:nucleotide-binding universal stress UspA family protein